MISNLLFGLAALFSLIGCTLLALSQKKHVTTVFGREEHPPLGRATPAIGWTLLIAALIPSLLGDQAGFAVLYWLLSIAGSALIIVLLLAFKPGWLKLAAWPILSRRSVGNRFGE